MKTIRYNGMYINIKFNSSKCYVADDFGTFLGVEFNTLIGAKRAITKSRRAGTEPSR